MGKLFHYVISAKDAQERRASILANFRSHGLEPCFFDAIMGNALTAEQQKELNVDTGVMGLGEVGCALSHMGVYQKLLDSQEPYVFVFEDDVHLNDAFFQALPALRQFLDTHSEPLVLLLYKARAHTRIAVKKDGKPFILHALAGSYGHGYVINRKAAENILRFQTPPRIEIDAWAQDLKLDLLEIYCTKETLVHLQKQHSQDSQIDAIASRAKKNPLYEKQMRRQRIGGYYDQLSWGEKLNIQGKRIWRHVQELYYDKDTSHH